MKYISAIAKVLTARLVLRPLNWFLRRLIKLTEGAKT
jgi:hypothetical protein